MQSFWKQFANAHQSIRLQHIILRSFRQPSSIDPSRDYYADLGVSKSSNGNEIKQAFYKLAKKYHPDVNQGKEEKFKVINQAYEVLSDQDKRSEYDNLRMAGVGQKSEAPNQYGTARASTNPFNKQQQQYNTYANTQQYNTYAGTSQQPGQNTKEKFQYYWENNQQQPYGEARQTYYYSTNYTGAKNEWKQKEQEFFDQGMREFLNRVQGHQQQRQQQQQYRQSPYGQPMQNQQRGPYQQTQQQQQSRQFYQQYQQQQQQQYYQQQGQSYPGEDFVKWQQQNAQMEEFYRRKQQEKNQEEIRRQQQYEQWKKEKEEQLKFDIEQKYHDLKDRAENITQTLQGAGKVVGSMISSLFGKKK